MSSMRKPKRITIRGDNEKEYMFLVKGGEDLRMDQRIEQVFYVASVSLTIQMYVYHNVLHIPWLCECGCTSLPIYSLYMNNIYSNSPRIKSTVTSIIVCSIGIVS